MSSQSTPQLGNTTADIVTSLVKGSTGLVPIIGGFIAEIVGNVIPNQRVDRIVQFVRLLEEKLGKLEEEALKSKFAQPPVVDLLEDAFTQAARATSRERLEHIADVVAKGISADELNEAESKRMLWLLGQLNDSEIVLLRAGLPMTGEEIMGDTSFRQKHERLLAPEMTHSGSSEDEFEEAALKASYRQHLHDLGLIRRQFQRPRRGEIPEFDENTGMMKTNGSDVTRLGKMLLRYLNLIPEWYRR